ncbi:hypothetical protein DFH08DRAFT_978910 [Mycena albidolilacea]|uniref:Uncharacterized protein n=1 Tax=Mycena albidolilacea TaxID=1033008 RepID=A0AAD6YY10_9AGAR|nr:hypothetical protein DFH08DRAFT_978910 [Mycena albidolilacea]
MSHQPADPNNLKFAATGESGPDVNTLVPIIGAISGIPNHSLPDSHVGVGVGAEKTSAHVRRHDGSRQRVPTIRTPQTLRVTYSLTPSPAPSPFNHWSLVAVDASTLTDLHLTLKFALHEWAAILDALACLRSYSADAGGALLLSLPRLESLNTTVLPRAHPRPEPGYLLHALRRRPLSPMMRTRATEPTASPHSRTSSCAPPPLLSRTPPPPSYSLRSCSQATSHPQPVHIVVAHRGARGRPPLDTTNSTSTEANGKVPALLPAFPSLRRLMNYAWAGHADISRRQVRGAQRAFVEGVPAAHEGVTQVWFDGREWMDGG